MEVSSQPVLLRSERKQRRSCDNCYRRKVRCDSVDKETCSACRRSHVECRLRFTHHLQRVVQPRKARATNRSADRVGLGAQIGPSNNASPSSLPNTSPSNEPELVHSASSPAIKTTVVGSNVIESQDLIRSGLSQFLSIGVSAPSWDVFDQPGRVRIAYIGTELSNFTHLVDLEHSAAVGLHHPYPHIKPPLAWKPDIDSVDRLLGPDLLRDLCSFPAKDVRDDLVDSFFTYIHPYFPIIDESEFRAQYSDAQNPPPLLLLQSVLLAGAHASQHPRVAQARSTVMAVLFRRAKTLFDMRHENDRLNLIQSALLFTWHIENADSVSSNSWYWIGVACRIAFGIGMHRDLSMYSAGRFPVYARRLYRRVWWTLFQVEIMSALEHGRPCMIHLEDFDQLPLEIDDLIDANGAVNPNVKHEYCCRKTELCYIALDVLRLSSPGIVNHTNSAAVQSVNSRLVAWALSTALDHDYEALSLHIFYQTIVIHWHRTSVNIRIVGDKQSAEIRKGASKSIIAGFESLSAQSLLVNCHSVEVVSLTAAAIQTHEEIRSAIDRRQTLQALNALNDLERMLRVAKAMAEYWPNAEAVFKLFRGLCDKLKASAVYDDGSSHGEQSLDEHGAGLSDINWHEILAYQPLEQTFSEGWLNDLPDIGGLG